MLGEIWKMTRPGADEYCLVHELPFKKVVLHEDWLSEQVARLLPDWDKESVALVIRKLCEVLEHMSDPR